jgi:glycosyltransferase involved in cell wall biosynthesis
MEIFSKKLTVLVLAYNSEKYIKEALDSVLAQKTDFQFDILIGDDGASDGTAVILKEYAAIYPDKISLKLTKRLPRKYSGDYINFSNLYQYVFSEYFCVLDGDDYWIDEYKLQKQINWLDSNQDFTVCGHNYYMLERNGKLVKSYDSSTNKHPYTFVANDFEEVFIGGYCPYMQTSSLIYRNIFKHDELVKSKFNHHMYAADFIRTLLHSTRGKVKFIDELMSVYRNYDGYWTSMKQEEVYSWYIEYYLFHKKNTFQDQNQFIIDKEIIRNLRLLLGGWRNKLKYLNYNFLLVKLLITQYRKKSQGLDS